MTVPDDLLLAFFGETTSRLLDIDAEAMLVTTPRHFDLTDCRRCVLDQQRSVLKETTEGYQQQQQGSNCSDSGSDSGSTDISVSVSVSVSVSATQVEERLGRLQHEPNLSQDLKVAMEDMNDAARVAVCKLVLYTEEERENERNHSNSNSNNNNNNNSNNNGEDEEKEKQNTTLSPRNLQDEGRLDRTKLMEYFGLCMTCLKVPCVVKFMNKTGGDSLFERKTTGSSCNDDDNNNNNNNSNNSGENTKTSAVMMFPQSRLEYVQRLLAKSMGWDPDFVTSELRRIFVEKPKDVDYEYYDDEVMALFQRLIEQMTVAIRTATLLVQSRQEAQLLSDLDKGGNTRVVSVQYSEFEVDQNGTKIESSSKNNAPEQRMDERQQRLTEEEQKQQLRLASEAAILQQTILGELLTLEEDERNLKLKEAAEVSREFMEEVMALPTGQERIDFLRGVDPTTSRQLAMHKLWAGMLQANGGQPPKMATQK